MAPILKIIYEKKFKKIKANCRDPIKLLLFYNFLLKKCKFGNGSKGHYPVKNVQHVNQLIIIKRSLSVGSFRVGEVRSERQKDSN